MEKKNPRFAVISTNQAPHFVVTWNTSAPEQSETQRIVCESGEESFTYRDRFLQLQTILPTERYVEPTEQPKGRSFALLFGACLWKDRPNSWLTVADLRSCLEFHRSVGLLPLNELDGTFCLISYDHVSQSLWLTTDFWSTTGFYYGSRQQLIVASNRAAVVADRIQAPIDAMGYLCLLRSAVPPAGSSMFYGVSRITMGKALHLTTSTADNRIVSTGPLYREPERWSFSESVERSMSCLSSTVADCVNRKETIVDLTAGNDTRLIAAALTRRSDLTSGLTFRVIGSAGSRDVEIAKVIANHFHWRHITHPSLNNGLCADNALGVSVLADGAFSLDSIANRLLLEATVSPEAQHLVGGLAGELFRGWIWQQELHRTGRIPVNYPALLRHRVPRDHAIDTSFITGGRLDSATHDQWLIEPLRQLDTMYPDALNVSKLDIYYIQRMMHRTPWWPVASRLTMMSPFLWTRVTDVSLRIPWLFRRTRRLVTTLVEKFDLWIAKQPTDRGAPFQPFKIRNALAYNRFLLTYLRDVIRRHYLQSTPAPIRIGQSSHEPDSQAFLPGLAELLHEGRTHLHEENGLAEEMKRAGSNGVSNSRKVEFLTVLQVELLFRNYPGIKRELKFP
jgi:hypothetical protein